MNVKDLVAPIGNALVGLVEWIAERRRKRKGRKLLDEALREHDGGGHPVVFPLEEARRKARERRHG